MSIDQVGDYVPVPGPPGPPGPSGTSVEILGELASPADLPAGAAGDAWLIGGDLWVWLAASATWANAGRIQGPDGPQGAQGVPGPQGTAGTPGAEGPAGTPGPAGLIPRGTWDNATPYVANDLVTYNGSSYAALAGSTNNNPETSPTKWQLLSARGPAGVDGGQGIQGPTGAEGPQGPIGPPGADASVSDAVYDQAAWNGDTTHAPSKNAVRDKIEALSGASVPVTQTQSAENTAVPVWTVLPFTSGYEPFQVQFNSFANAGAGAGTYNHGAWLGFNAARHAAGPGSVTGKPAIFMGFEDNYFDNGGDGQYGTEWYIEGQSPNGSTVVLSRPFYCRGGQTDAGADWWRVLLNIGGATGSGVREFFVRAGSDPLIYASPTAISLFKSTSVPSLNVDYVIGTEGASDNLRLKAGQSSGSVVFMKSDYSGNTLVVDNTGNVTMADATTLGNNGATGMKILASASNKCAFHGSTPVIQRASANQAICTDAASVIVLANELRAALVEKGLIKGAA